MKTLFAFGLVLGLSWEVAATPSAQQPAAISPLVGKWCLERPRAMKYGSRVGLVIDKVTDATLTGQYNWEGAAALNTKMSAKSEGNLWVFWPDQKIWYKLDKTLDAQGRLVGTGGNNILNIKWLAVFDRVAGTKPAVDKDGNKVMVPDCPAK
jgi:hypothetical protein